MTCWGDKLEVITNLFKADEYYKSKPIFLLENSVFPALKNDKYVVYKPGKEIKGICTYAFLTDEEIQKNEFDGDEVFARDEGQNLHFCQFICHAPKREVFKFVRTIQRILSDKYPDYATASGIRKKSGSMRPELWFRKDLT